MPSIAARSFFGIPRHHWAAMGLVYLLAHGGIFLVLNATYWDDWTLVNASPDTVLETFRQAGSMFNIAGRIHVLLLKAGPWLYHVLVFVLMFASGVFLHRILERQEWLPDGYVLPVTLLYLGTPLFAARVAMIDFFYCLTLFLFFAAWYLLGRGRHLAAVILFLLSFNTPSLLVFYALPVLELLRREVPRLGIAPLARWGLRRLHVLLAPFLWFAVKLAWFKPSGAYVGYNENFSLKNLATSAMWQVLDLATVPISFVPTVLGMLVAWRVYRAVDVAETAPGVARTCLLVALVALAFAVFPYWVVGHPPRFAEWNSRHQLLMPLGVALAAAAALAACRTEARRAIFAGVLGLGLAINWTNYATLLIDWRKQQAVIEFLRKDPAVAGADLVVFEDSSVNAFGRTLRFYEWNGMLRAALGSTGKFAVGTTQLDEYSSGALDPLFTAHFNAEGHRRVQDPKVAVVTVKGHVRPKIAAAATAAALPSR